MTVASASATVYVDDEEENHQNQNHKHNRKHNQTISPHTKQRHILKMLKNIKDTYSLDNSDQRQLQKQQRPTTNAERHELPEIYRRSQNKTPWSMHMTNTIAQAEPIHKRIKQRLVQDYMNIYKPEDIEHRLENNWAQTDMRNATAIITLGH